MTPIPGPRERRGATALRRLLLFLLVANAFGALLLPIRDPDFFWHLRSGEWILEHRSLPGDFLFAVVPQGTPPETQHFTMTSYWLAQVLLAALHGVGGFAAVVALRWGFFFLLLLLLARGARGDPLVRLGLLSLAVAVLGQYPVERPQFSSFVFAAALLLALDGVRTAASPAVARWRAVAVPPLLALWANCHGGFVVGLGFLGLVALTECLKLLHRRLEPLCPERLRLLLLATAGGFLASLLNPNGWEVFRVARLPGEITDFVREYRSTLEIYRLLAEPWVLAYWTLLVLVVAGFARRWKRPDLTALALVAVTGYFSFTQVRYIPFFIVAALPPAAQAFSEPRLLRPARAVAVALCLGVAALFLPGAVPVFRDFRRCAAVDEWEFPVAGAAFIERAGLQGNMFNQYGWGGYLQWRLAPRTVFVDGRNGDPELVRVYRRVMAGDRRLVHGKELWKVYFERFGVRYTITPFFNPLSGELIGLVDALLADPAWVPVFASPTTLVFVESVPESRRVLERSSLPKEKLYPLLLRFTGELAAALPESVQPRVARGDLFLRLGDRAAALRCFEDALRIVPSHQVARERVTLLQGTAAGAR